MICITKYTKNTTAENKIQVRKQPAAKRAGRSAESVMRRRLQEYAGRRAAGRRLDLPQERKLPT